MKPTTVVMSAALLLVAGGASAQSFDCAKALSRIEKMVCGDPAVADLDEHSAGAGLRRPIRAARPSSSRAAACSCIACRIE